MGQGKTRLWDISRDMHYIYIYIFDFDGGVGLLELAGLLIDDQC